MLLPVWCLSALVFAAGPQPASSPRERLAALAAAVRDADYRGERSRLERLAAELDALDAADLTAYRRYWQGFASWRRALNGFNETPWPSDLQQDLEAAVASFRAALAARPGWIEAKVGVVGCQASLLYLAREDPVRRDALRSEYVPLFREMAAEGEENPRVLWLVGGAQLMAPPPYGGDARKAAATLGRGVGAARHEALAHPGGQGYVPAWGGPENLMSLAWLFSHSALEDRSAALGCADAGLAWEPDWHYLRDVLREQILTMPEAGR